MFPRRLLWNIAVVLLVSCQGRSPKTSADRAVYGSMRMSEAQRVRLHRDHPGDVEFGELSDIIPGFSGFAYEIGTPILVINLTDLAFADSAKRAVSRLFGPKRIGPAGPPVFVVKKVAYSFVQLDLWRNAVEDIGSREPAITSVDLDESSAKVEVGISSGDDLKRVERLIRSLGIPRAASRLIVEGPTVIERGDTRQ